MADSEFSVPPISGEDQAPFRELVPELPEPEPKAGNFQPETKKNKRLLFGLIGALGVIVILVSVLAMIFLRPQEVAPEPNTSPSPSPISEATASGLPKNIDERRDALERQLQALDLQEINSSFPIIDFKIEF